MEEQQITPEAPPETDIHKFTPAEILSALGLEEFNTKDLEEARRLQIDPRLLAGTAKYILSVVPWPLLSPTFHHSGGLKRYNMPAASDDGFQLLRILNTYTTIMDLNMDPEEVAISGRYENTQKRITAQQIVDDLLKHWAGDYWANPAGGGLGVMQITGPHPAKAEIEACRKQQNTLFGYLVTQADTLHIRGEGGKIKSDHHRALEHLTKIGLTKIESHPWKINSSVGIANIPNGCPGCSKPMPATAFVCSSCRMNVAEYYVVRNKIPNKNFMPAIHEEWSFLTSKHAPAR